MTKSTDPVIIKWNQLRLGLCWESSVLAPALAAMVFIKDMSRPTAAIDSRGRCYLNTKWCGARTDEEARFVILHEVLHQVLRHHERVNGRDRKRWGIAGDLVINDAIPNLGPRLAVKAPVEGVFRDRDFPNIPPNLSVEEVYELLKNESLDGKSKEGQVCAGCSIELADGSGSEAEGEDDIEVEGLSPGEWQNIAQAVRNAAKQAGVTGGAALATLLEVPPSRVRWQALLRELAATAASRAGRDLTSWSRKSRRSPRNLFLPGTRTNDVRLAIIIDSSGSVSDDELAACVAETRAAVDAAGITALLVVHDHEVRTQAWITPGSGNQPILAQVTGRGGTLFRPAYDAVANAKQSFAAVVHFTDGGYGDCWPDRPRNCARGIAAITVEGSESVVPEGWRIVPIETPGRT